MDKKNDYIQLPPMKKDTSADVVSFIWEYMKLPEDVRNKVKSEMDEIHEHCRDSEFQKQICMILFQRRGSRIRAEYAKDIR